MLAILGLLKYGQPDDTSNTKRLMRDTFVELLATTLFIFNGTLAVCATYRLMITSGAREDTAFALPVAVSFGVSIMVLAFSIGHITGGHMNPGVSLLMFFRRELSATKMICYWFAQFTGAVLGATLTYGCVSGLQGDEINGYVYPSPPYELGSVTKNGGISTGNGFLLEFMGSFIFYFVIAQTALDKRGIAGSMFPAIPIGFSLIVAHICLIPFTGCGVNPARAFGPAAVVCMSGGNCETVMPSYYWIYWAGPFLASYFVAETTLLLELNVDGTDMPEEVIKEEHPLDNILEEDKEENIPDKTFEMEEEFSGPLNA